MQNTSFLESQTVLKALEFALSKGGFESPNHKRTAAALVKTMRSNQSVSGRHQQLTALLKKGATIEEMMKATGSSRRTVFRYLNHLEEAGIDISINKGKYTLK